MTFHRFWTKEVEKRRVERSTAEKYAKHKAERVELQSFFDIFDL